MNLARIIQETTSTAVSLSVSWPLCRSRSVQFPLWTTAGAPATGGGDPAGD